MSRKRKQPVQNVTREDYPLLMARSLVRASVEVRKPQDLPAGLSDEPELVRPEEVEAMTRDARTAEQIRYDHGKQADLRIVELAIVRLEARRSPDPEQRERDERQLSHLRRACVRLHSK